MRRHRVRKRALVQKRARATMTKLRCKVLTRSLGCLLRTLMGSLSQCRSPCHSSIPLSSTACLGNLLKVACSSNITLSHNSTCLDHKQCSSLPQVSLNSSSIHHSLNMASNSLSCLLQCQARNPHLHMQMRRSVSRSPCHKADTRGSRTLHKAETTKATHSRELHTGYHSSKSHGLSPFSSSLKQTTQQTREHPTILQILQHGKQVLRLPLSFIVVLHIWQRHPRRARLFSAWRPVIPDVSAGEEHYDEHGWRDAEASPLR